MIGVRPIRFTANTEQFRPIWTALGAVTVVDAEGWTVHQFGSGRIALHHADAAQARTSPGATTLAFEVDALDPWVDQVRAARPELDLTVEEFGHGRSALVAGPDGLVIQIDSREDGEEVKDVTVATVATGVSVLPIWYTSDTEAAARTLEALGARRRIVSDSGNWIDLVCPGGGLVAVHHGDVTEAVLAFEYDGNVEELSPALTHGGVDAVLIDETYARSLRVPDPEHGERIWINEKQTDLYGFTLAGG